MGPSWIIALAATRPGDCEACHDSDFHCSIRLSPLRYYGYYSTRSRAKRRQTEQTDAASNGKSTSAQIEPPSAKVRRRHWAELLRLVFEVDPLQCACGGRLRVVSFITTSHKM